MKIFSNMDISRYNLGCITWSCIIYIILYEWERTVAMVQIEIDVENALVLLSQRQNGDHDVVQEAKTWRLVSAIEMYHFNNFVLKGKISSVKFTRSQWPGFFAKKNVKRPRTKRLRSRKTQNQSVSKQELPKRDKPIKQITRTFNTFVYCFYSLSFTVYLVV